jgi:hypothetical protein
LKPTTRSISLRLPRMLERTKAAGRASVDGETNQSVGQST